MDLSVIVPCYNEEENIPELINQIERILSDNNINGELVIIDDNSQDKTSCAIEKFKKLYPNIISIKHELNKGIAECWKTGLGYASGRYIVTFDADLQFSPKDIVTLYNHIINRDSNIVQGWRKTWQGHNTFRWILSRVFANILKCMFMADLHDLKSGFIICRREVFENILRRKFTYHRFDNFVVILAKSKGYAVCEIPIKVKHRKKGRSFINIYTMPRVIVTSMLDAIKAFVEFGPWAS